MRGSQHGDCLQEAIYRKAVSTLKEGGIVAFPTETYYGLAVDPENEEALKRLFDVKRRDPDKAILVLISEMGQLSRLARDIPKQYRPLMRRYWPGPLTLIFPAHANLSSRLTCNTGTVGVRISSHPIAQTFCRAWGQPLTATSANISGKKPAESAAAVRKGLGDMVDFIIDGGQSPAGECSTIVGLQGDQLILIRAGKIDFSSIQSPL